MSRSVPDLPSQDRVATETATEVARLRAVFDQVSTGLAILDARGRIVRVNDAMTRIDGVEAAAHVGRAIDDVMPGMEPPASEIQREVLTTGRPIVDRLAVGTLSADPEADRVWSMSYSRLSGPDGTVLGLSCAVSDITERYASLTEARQARERLALLNEASKRIGSTLDIERTAEELVEVAAPAFTDIAIVELIDAYLSHATERSHPRPDGGITVCRLAARFEPRHATWSFLTSSDPYRVHLVGSPVHRVLSGGAPVFSARATAAEIATSARDGAEADQMIRAGVHSTIVVPLLARGTVLGLAAFLRTTGRPSFDRADLDIAAELAARAAVCIDNARLYARERGVALSLQRSLLPELVPRMAGLDIAYGYLPGTDVAEVGGDWFDVLQLPGHRVALVVGDVMGSGVRAAGIMGQFRTAARTLAGLDLDPAHVLRQLDELAASMSEAHLATCVYAVYDPIGATCAIASAGHLPPLLREPDGTVRRLEVPSGPPLGVGGAYATRVFRVSAGSRLVLYTDGVVEERARDIDIGIDALAAQVAVADADLDDVCDSVVNFLTARDRNARSDDATVLMADLHVLPRDRVASWVLTTRPSVVAHARELVRKQLVSWELMGLVDTTELLVSELVTNALRHARGPIELRLVRTESLVCEVADSLDIAPRMRAARTTDEGGRGLHLVNQLAGRWGTRGTGDGKVVWFELPLPGFPA